MLKDKTFKSVGHIKPVSGTGFPEINISNFHDFPENFRKHSGNVLHGFPSRTLVEK